MNRIIVVFDICSSTVILEDLQQSAKQHQYGLLIDVIWAYLKTQAKTYAFEVNKYLGDGFLLVFDPNASADAVVVFLVYLVTFCNAVLRRFKEMYLDIAELPRFGVTVGVAVGEIYKLESAATDSYEVFGRPINIASRFQSSSNQPDQVNHAVVSREFYQLLDATSMRPYFNETTRSLRNVAGDRRVRCYYIDINSLNAFKDVDFLVGAASIVDQVKDRQLLNALEAASLNPKVILELLFKLINSGLTARLDEVPDT